MKKIVVINTSPRTNMNTGSLLREAAKGAESEGADVQVIELCQEMKTLQGLCIGVVYAKNVEVDMIR